METKLSKLKRHLQAGDHLSALRIAAKFSQLGSEKEDITRAWAAIQNPRFYQEIGQDPEALVLKGVTALSKRFNLSPQSV